MAVKFCIECGGGKVYAKKRCRRCYDRMRAIAAQSGAMCSAGCSSPVYAKRLCKRCWRRLRSAGTLSDKKIPDLPGELWKEIQGADCGGLFVSSLGRIKSCRGRDERLLKTRMRAHGKLFSLTCENKGGHRLWVHMEVLRAFSPGDSDGSRAVFLDGDRTNCCSSNLRRYGAGYLVPLAIEMAEQSTHPLAGKFVEFWRGDSNALNDWFEAQKVYLLKYLRRRLDMFNVPYYVDVEDCAQEAVVSMFLALRRGMLKSLDDLTAWVKGVSKIVLAAGVRNLIPSTPLVFENNEGNFYTVTDQLGWNHPSAEDMAIYREDCRF